MIVPPTIADRLADALCEAIDARSLWVAYGDGTTKYPTSNVDRLNRALTAYDAVLVARVTEIALAVPQIDKSLRLSHWHAKGVSITLGDAVSGPLPAKRGCPYCGGAFACPIHDTNPADTHL